MMASTRNSEISAAHLCEDEGTDGLEKLRAGERDTARSIATQDKLDVFIGSPRYAQSSAAGRALWGYSRGKPPSEETPLST